MSLWVDVAVHRAVTEIAEASEETVSATYRELLREALEEGGEELPPTKIPTVEGDDPFSVAHNMAAQWLNRGTPDIPASFRGAKEFPTREVVMPHEFTEEEMAAVEAKIERNDSDLVEIQRGINEAYVRKIDPLKVHRHRYIHLQAGTEDRRSGVDWALYACECGDKQERRVK